MTVKEHLHSLHERQAAHHLKKAKHHKRMSAHMQKLASEFNKTENTEATLDTKSIFEALASEHEETSAEHSDLAEHHLACCKSLGQSGKASGMSDGLAALMPSQISGVTPTIPSIRAVPRAGQQPFPTSAENPLFVKVFGNGTEE